MFAPIAGIIANVVEGVASNAITNRMQKGKDTGMDDNEVWELENGKIIAIVRDGVRYVKEKTCTATKANEFQDDVYKCWMYDIELSCGHAFTSYDVPDYCPDCGAMVV